MSGMMLHHSIRGWAGLGVKSCNPTCSPHADDPGRCPVAPIVAHQSIARAVTVTVTVTVTVEGSLDFTIQCTVFKKGPPKPPVARCNIILLSAGPQSRNSSAGRESSSGLIVVIRSFGVPGVSDSDSGPPGCRHAGPPKSASRRS